MFLLQDRKHIQLSMMHSTLIGTFTLLNSNKAALTLDTYINNYCIISPSFTKFLSWGFKKIKFITNKWQSCVFIRHRHL